MSDPRDIQFDRLDPAELQANFEKLNRTSVLPSNGNYSAPIPWPKLEMCSRCGLRDYPVTRERVINNDTVCSFCKSAEKAGIKPLVGPIGEKAPTHDPRPGVVREPNGLAGRVVAWPPPVVPGK